MPFMARGALVLICGLMSQYQGDEATVGTICRQCLRAVMFNGLRIQGFTQAGPGRAASGVRGRAGRLVASGKINVAMHVEQGIERLPHAMAGLFDKSVTGKVVVRVGEL